MGCDGTEGRTPTVRFISPGAGAWKAAHLANGVGEVGKKGDSMPPRRPDFTCYIVNVSFTSKLGIPTVVNSIEHAPPFMGE